MENIMREIKFEYIYGNGRSSFSKVFAIEEIECGNAIDEICDSPLLRDYKIIGRRQFTGLTDKNGKEIYEGDIVDIDGGKTYGKFRAKVEFYDGVFGYMNMTCTSITPPVGWDCAHPITDSGWFFGGFSTLGDSGYAKHDDTSCVEIIGNIHENPELLEANDD